MSIESRTGLTVARWSLAIAAAALVAGCAQDPVDPAVVDAKLAGPFPVTGCPAVPPVPVAPGGYYVHGNTICTADGRAHLLHGVDRPSLEWSTIGENLSAADFQLMATWNANVVRVALNQDYWLEASPIHAAGYVALVDQVIAWAEEAGLDVILDLHWSDAGVLGGCSPSQGCQQKMADANSVTFWSEVATRYQGDGRVIFELYNEPHDVTWQVWRSGGLVDGFQSPGMQGLYDTVRATGAQNLVLIGGLNWAYDLSAVGDNKIAGYNIAYATHPYESPGRGQDTWARSFAYLTKTDPVVITEFGSLSKGSQAGPTCATDYGAQLIPYADARAISWTAWAWFPGGCSFPAIINDWMGTPSPSGAIVKAALLSYTDPPASPPRVAP